MSKKDISLNSIKNPHNIKIVSEFIKLIDQIKYDMDNATSKKDILRHSFRLRHIKNAIKVFKKYPHKIKSGEQLQDIKGIGKGTVDRINEILKTGRLAEIKLTSMSKKYLKYAKELEQIIGIGTKIAYELVTKHNIKSIKELKKAHKRKKIKLNDQILLGLKYHGIYKQNIPRKEIMKVDKYIHKVAMKVDPELFVAIVGSYRRGNKLTSNDIDILITHPKIKTKKDMKKYPNYLIKFVHALKKTGFLVDDLTYDDFKTKYMGFSKYKNNPVRRIDLFYIPDNSFYTALLAFTGPGSLNINLRNLAISLGYTLNEYGLFKGKKMIKISSEKDLFNKLGMEYIAPEFR